MREDYERRGEEKEDGGNLRKENPEGERKREVDTEVTHARDQGWVRPSILFRVGMIWN